MDAQKYWALIVRYDGENRRLPLEKMNTGMNIQFLPPLAVPSGLKAAPKTPPGKDLRSWDRLCYTY